MFTRSIRKIGGSRETEAVQRVRPDFADLRGTRAEIIHLSVEIWSGGELHGVVDSITSCCCTSQCARIFVHLYRIGFDAADVVFLIRHAVSQSSNNFPVSRDPEPSVFRLSSTPPAPTGASQTSVASASGTRLIQGLLCRMEEVKQFQDACLRLVIGDSAPHSETCIDDNRHHQRLPNHSTPCPGNPPSRSDMRKKIKRYGDGGDTFEGNVQTARDFQHSLASLSWFLAIILPSSYCNSCSFTSFRFLLFEGSCDLDIRCRLTY
jgi:hypothetical protein